MFNIYKKQRIREIPVEIDADYNNIPNSSVLFLTKYSDFEESFFDKFGNEHWKTVTSELFTTCIVNLLITRKIKAVYYTDRKSILFNLIKIDSEGFNIFSTENLVNNQHDDILANNLLDVLSTIPIHSLESYRLAINLVVNKYIGTGESASEALSVDKLKQREDEIYATYIDEINKLADIENFKGWTSWLIGADHPKMNVEIYNSLTHLVNYINSRIWYKRYPELENAILNFNNVLSDLIIVFDEHAESIPNRNQIWTKKFYKTDEGTKLFITIF